MDIAINVIELPIGSDILDVSWDSQKQEPKIYFIGDFYKNKKSPHERRKLWFLESTSMYQTTEIKSNYKYISRFTELIMERPTCHDDFEAYIKSIKDIFVFEDLFVKPKIVDDIFE